MSVKVVLVRVGLSGLDCSGLRLSGIELSGLRLSRLDLYKLRLSGLRLYRLNSIQLHKGSEFLFTFFNEIFYGVICWYISSMRSYS